ncbi:MAG: hypothetical protein IJD92_01420 [Bacilli bacterium]|nr:hypothetical protein [Bacilli bacterium]
MKDKIITYIFVGYILIFSILGIIIPDKEISINERRKLSIFPQFKISNEYITKLDTYLVEHFPLRENYRTIKAFYNYKVLNKLDNNNIYLKDNKIYKSNYPTNYNSIDYFKEHIYKINSLLNTSNNTYIAIIPDKNYYIKDKNFLQIDYDYIYNEINNIGLNNIDLRTVLNENDYYETDTHWKQENLSKIVKVLNENMSFGYKDTYYKENIYNNFYGVYYGESAIKRKPENITYLTNEMIDNVEVKYLENKNLNKIYNIENLNSFDPYEVYLDGASSYIELYNNYSTSDKELIIFRDSFASSITPLLIKYYKKITLIDNRYINSNNFMNLIEFNNQDVLFLYSTLIVNNSLSLKN